MAYAQLTIDSSSRLKRFSHSRRFAVALELLDVQPDDTVLDYGTGDGFLLFQVLTRAPRSVTGFEPMDEQFIELQKSVARNPEGPLRIVKSIEELGDQQFSKIACLEVLEHLQDEQQREVLREIESRMMPNCRVVVSVPIEVGPASLLKNIARGVIGKTHENTTLSTVLRSTFGRPIDRGQCGYISSHIGFDHRRLEALFLSSGFKIELKRFSPLRALGSVVNSQVFYVLTHPQAGRSV